MAPHPLDGLSLEETHKARDIVCGLHSEHNVFFREIYLDEPKKALLRKYLTAEHSGQPLPSIPRQALCQYDVLDGKGGVQSQESIVDIDTGKRVEHIIVPEEHHASLSIPEFRYLVNAVAESKLFADAVAELKLPEGFEVVVEPWPYDGLGADEENNRYFQGLCFGRDTRQNNPDSNFYAYPLPLIPVMNAKTKEIVRVDRLPTGGDQDGLQDETHKPNVLDHCVGADYVPELLPNGPRTTLKALNVSQPDGPSFSVNGGLIEWEHWRFRVGFNPREGATIHDVHFQGRSVMYRLSISEMSVPYADPRSPFPRKQAFDFGDGGIGSATNNLKLGCDCLGVIKYFDGVIMAANNTAEVAPNVVCLHEQDNGIGWKHTNWRTNRAVVTRNRELVVQFIITLANYEYVFAYKFDLAGGITVETRATGIVSVVNIDPGKTSAYGNVVSPGALAQNHQHIFCVRLDPAVDGYENTVVVEESHPVAVGPKNPAGNLYEVRKTPVEKSQWIDAAARHNRVIKMVNQDKKNPISGRNVSYKFTPVDTQLLLAQPESGQAQRAQFAQHHVWVTKYADRELYAAGRYPLSSKVEKGGLSDAVKRNDEVANSDVVVWSVFGLTHNPRVEDWPVMPAEVHQINLRPADFFTANPSIDVPSNVNSASVLTNGSTAANGVNGSNGTNGHAGCH
ncbi:Copper amine oxidase 1 [Cyphellophora attinorum]|uniref:Amine oxidase n=1 Tax=Cyphellophora attinorum TaxID=1664694 RepID=A0A0N0NHI7_9EURO|nr:Copper amine oxidase 1 [Phialophora attinorum]KPI34731.1 Copper amine oxidase 1 [Phialophora attinorum]